MGQALLGAHVSAAGGLWKAFARADELRAECLQIFTRAPGRWKANLLPEAQIRQFREARARAGSPPVIAHDIYLTNLASSNEAIRRRSTETLVDELLRCERLGLDGLVCHLGAHGGDGDDVGLARYSESLAQVLDATSDCTLPILLETTAGQGSCLGHRFEHLGEVIRANGNHPRLKVCLDTCHVHAAGYDITTQEGYRRTWEEFEQSIGRSRLVALHLNDSKKPIGSRVDRHTHIGQGEIGLEPFRWLVNDPALEGLAMIIETPESEKMHRVNLDRLKSLRASPGAAFGG